MFCGPALGVAAPYHSAEVVMLDLPDDEILPLSREHVFWTWSAQAAVKPIAVKSARGVYFWDVNGTGISTSIR